MVSDAIRRSWRGVLSSLMLTAVLVSPLAAAAEPASGSGAIDACKLQWSAPISVEDIGAGVKASGIGGEALGCYTASLLSAGVAPADAAEGLLLAGYDPFDVVQSIVLAGGDGVITDVVARVNTVLGPSVSQTVRDAVAEAARVRDAEGYSATANLGGGSCELALSAPISVESIRVAVKTAGVRDDSLNCYVASLLSAGVPPADIAEGLLLAGYLVFDVVRAVIMIGGADVVDAVVARSNTVYCRMLTKGSTGCGSTINQTVADAALAGLAAAASARDYEPLILAGEIAAGAGWLAPQADAGGVPDISQQ